jgi:hypothetical protein
MATFESRATKIAAWGKPANKAGRNSSSSAFFSVEMNTSLTSSRYHSRRSTKTGW